MWVRVYKIVLLGTKGVGKQTLANAMAGRSKIQLTSRSNVVIPYISPDGYKVIFDVWNGDCGSFDFILHVKRNGIPNTIAPRYDRIIRLPNDENDLQEFASKLLYTLFNHLHLNKPFHI